MLEDAKVRPDDEAYGTTALGLKQLLREMLAPEKKGARVDKNSVDRMIAEIDEQLVEASQRGSSPPRRAEARVVVARLEVSRRPR